MSVYIPVKLQRTVREHFQECCAYCQTAEFLTAMTFEIEHIQPIAAGGETVFENLCFACPSCNRYKGSRQSMATKDGEIVPFFHPHKQKWLEHFRWNDDATAIESLSMVGKVTISALKMNRPALIRARKMWIKLNEHPPE